MRPHQHGMQGNGCIWWVLNALLQPCCTESHAGCFLCSSQGHDVWYNMYLLQESHLGAGMCWQPLQCKKRSRTAATGPPFLRCTCRLRDTRTCLALFPNFTSKQGLGFLWLQMHISVQEFCSWIQKEEHLVQLHPSCVRSWLQYVLVGHIHACVLIDQFNVILSKRRYGEWRAWEHGDIVLGSRGAEI